MYDIVVPITSNYHWELRPFKFLLDKFWPGREFTVLSDTDPGIGNYVPLRTLIIGGEWYKQFSIALAEFLIHDCRKEFIILLMADHWLNGPVGNVDSLIKYMRRHKNVICCDLFRDPDNAEFLEDWEGVSLWTCPDNRRDCFLRGALVPAIWNKELLLSILDAGWDLWQTEIELSKRIAADRALQSLLVSPSVYPLYQAAKSRIERVDLRGMGFHDELRKMIPTRIGIIL